MTRERAKELLPIIQAYAEGKTIQARLGDYDSFTDQIGDLIFKDTIDYRIKPEPREWFLAVDKSDGDVMAGSLKPFESKRENWQVIHVREVL